MPLPADPAAGLRASAAPAPDPVAELIYEAVLNHTDDLPDDLADGAEAAAHAVRTWIHRTMVTDVDQAISAVERALTGVTDSEVAARVALCAAREWMADRLGLVPKEGG